MSAAKKPAKAVRPRVMLEYENGVITHRRYPGPVNPRPVLVLDLSPESVEAMIASLSDFGGLRITEDTARQMLAKLGLVAQRSK